MVTFCIKYSACIVYVILLADDIRTYVSANIAQAIRTYEPIPNPKANPNPILNPKPNPNPIPNPMPNPKSYPNLKLFNK